MTKIQTLAFAGFAALVGTANAAHIDFFDAGAFNLTATVATSPVTGSQTVPPGPTGALGGVRNVTVSTVSPTGLANANLAPVGDDSDGDPSNDNDDGIDYLAAPELNSSLLLQYGFNLDGSPGNDLNADISNNPAADFWDRLRIEFANVNTPLGGDLTATVTLRSGGDSIEAIVTNTVSAGDTESLFLYEDFFADNAALDINSIDQVELLIVAPAVATYSLEFFHRAGNVAAAITAVPLPGALALMLIGGLMLRRRKS